MDYTALFQWFSKPPWIFEAIIVVIVTILVTPLFKKLGNWLVLMYRQLDKHPMQGEWFAYYFSTERTERVFKDEAWLIKRAAGKYPLSVKIRSLSPPNLEFKGLIWIEENTIMVTVNGIKNHDETVYMRFPYPVGDSKGPFIGICLQRDFDASTEACAAVLSRDEQSQEQVLELIRKNITIRKDRAGMTCTRI